MREVKIGNSMIGDRHEPFIVAEVGINHNGEIEKAFRMIEVAKQAGVDAVKFQTFKAEEFVSDENQMFTYYSQGNEVTESMLEMFKRYEFSENEWNRIKEKCDSEEITFLSTPQNVSDLNFLLKLGVPALKVGSDDFTNIPLLENYAKSKLPMIVSCGMADIGEVHQALKAIGALEGYPTILLLCTSQYPTPPQDVNLLKLKTLAQAYPNVPIGFSDHTQGPIASSVAVAFGASFFEKHFTLDNNLPGPDHWFSENPESLKLWVDSIRSAKKMLGSAIVQPTQHEEEMRHIARRYIVALEQINKDEILNTNNLGLRRTGKIGLSPQVYNDVLGKKAIKTIQKGTMIEMGDFQ